jgi:quinone-modifying oxidoreductase, subunit QmoB
MSENPKRIGVFVCSGCGIGSSIDVEGLGAMASGEQNIACCQNHRALCSVEGVNLITDAIEQESLNGLVIAACSPRVKQEVFAFADGLVTERVNLREQVAWCFEPGDEDTQMAAEDALRMGMAKVNSITAPKPYIPESISKDILVLGGGISGMTAALEGAKAGTQVHLIEREEKLGGRWRELYMQYPIYEPYTNLEKPAFGSLIEAVETHPNITVHTGTTIKSITGEPGAFEVKLLSTFHLPPSTSHLLPPTSHLLPSR